MSVCFGSRGVALVRVALLMLLVGAWSGCAARSGSEISERVMDEALEYYRATQLEGVGRGDSAARGPRVAQAAWTPAGAEYDDAFVTLGMFGGYEEPGEWQPANGSADEAEGPEPGKRRSIWRRAGRESYDLLTHGFWRGFKTSFWDLENALVLTATMGASVAIRGTGVDDAIRRRTEGRPQLGDFDEPIQLLGNPGTHFAAAGVVWLTSALWENEKQHEFAKSLTTALAVNGTATMILKASANTRAPDGVSLAWPSGHTSSAFTAAAVLNEYYGPWVGVPSLALAGLVGYQRIDSRVHDFSDVVFGAMMGYIVGTSIARNDKAEFPELFGMKVLPFVDPYTGASGIALLKTW